MKTRLLISFQLLLFAALPLASGWAQSSTNRVEEGLRQSRELAAGFEREIEVYAYTMEHQAAREAMPLIYPLLSDDGTVELQPGGNTLVVRDRGEVLRKLLPVLKDFDHPAVPLRLAIQVVRAGSDQATAASERQLSQRLLQRLRELLRYQSYSVEASTRVEVGEGERVTYDLGSEFRVELRLGTITSARNLRLYGVRLFRRAGEQEELNELIHTNLSLELGEPFLLGLARSEASPEALMLVLTCDRAPAPRPIVAN